MRRWPRATRGACRHRARPGFHCPCHWVLTRPCWRVALSSAFFYESGPYQEWLLAQVAQRMELHCSGLRVADVGGGTGNFSALLAAHAGLVAPVLCVDNSPDMLAVAASRPGVTPVCLDALAFSQSEGRAYDRALLKEIVHHLPAADVAPMYSGLASQLTPGGVCCTVTRPQEVDYPLFGAAAEVWKAKQPAVEALAAAMRAAGFQDVRVESATYHATMPKHRWFAMVRARFWSTFSAFTDEELERGVGELEARYTGMEEVAFNDRLLFLIGRAPDSRAADFARDGVLLSQRLLSADEAAAAYAGLSAYEAACGGSVEGEQRFKAHLLLPWLWDLVHHPAIVDLACAALRSDQVACWSTDIFAKPGGGGGLYTPWHQDSTYVSMAPPDSLTVWLALTKSGPDSGGLLFLPSSHTGGQRPHSRGPADGNMLLAQQHIPADDAALVHADAQAVTCALRPGEGTAHHLCTIHRSGANTSAQPRVGIALRYMAASVVQSRQPRDSVTVVRGPDSAFEARHELERGPSGSDEEIRAAWRRAVARVPPDA
jgi:non-heme Fe2+,alpha-ketoglutarate-dependent halogenase